MKMEIYKKLASVKSEIGKISKDSTNPFFKSKYFDVNALLEHVEPLLAKNNLLLLQPILEGKVISEIIDSESGQKVSSELELGSFTDPQKMGSAITYYRRYTLQSLLGLQAEDDDANKASTPAKKESEKDLPWLNRMDGKEVSRDWNRAVATLKTGKDVSYLRTKFKISKENEQLLTIEAKK
jgi:hypothetical protein